MRRLFDILFSFIAIIVFSPVLLFTLIILKLTAEHKVLYLQKRMGIDEKPFYIYKFVTMLKNSENMDGGTVTKKDDFRVLPFGKFLRKTKINELPQLFNIFLGSMSIVGPRPITVEQYYHYSSEQRAKISKLRPGLTGIGSLTFRDEEGIMERSGMDYNEIHDTIIANYKGNLECWYYDNYSLFLYFKLVYFTAISVFFPKKKFLHKFSGIPKPEGILFDLLS